MMHDLKNIKLCDAQQVYHYKNIRLKLCKNNAVIWFNKTCKAKRLTPTYANIKIKVDNPRCQKNRKGNHTLQELCTDRPPGTLVESDSTICCMNTTVS